MRAGIRAELDDLSPDWRDTVRVARDERGAVVGAALVEWDEEIGRAWCFGPWVAGDDAAWERWSRPLFDALVDQLPATITVRELAGTVDNRRLAGLADALGWAASETNYAFVLDRDAASARPPPDDRDGLRAAAVTDLDALRALHDAEFPGTYYSAEQLLRRGEEGQQIVLAVDGDEGTVVGYAAGQIHPDGEGYIDFVAVDAAARRRGAGRRLVVGLSRRLLERSTTGRVTLTVQESRAPARALYESIGFRIDAAFVGYRPRPTEPDG